MFFLPLISSKRQQNDFICAESRKNARTKTPDVVQRMLV